MNKQLILVIIGAFLVSSMALSALPALPTSDPTTRSRFINRKALYYGTTPQVPPSSSSDRQISTGARLGDSFPKGILSPTFAGRMTGYATLEKLTPKSSASQKKAKAAAIKPSPKSEGTKKTMIKGSTKSNFPKGRHTKTFVGRWFGDSKNQ